MSIRLKSTTEVARDLGMKAPTLLKSLSDQGMIERTPNRHYRASEFLIKSGMATRGDLRWTPEGQTLLRKAYEG